MAEWLFITKYNGGIMALQKVQCFPLLFLAEVLIHEWSCVFTTFLFEFSSLNRTRKKNVWKSRNSYNAGALFKKVSGNVIKTCYLFLWICKYNHSMMHHIYLNEHFCEILCSFFDYIYVTPPNLVGKGVVKCFEKQVSKRMLENSKFKIGGSTASREAWFFRGVEIRYLKILKIHKILKACVR